MVPSAPMSLPGIINRWKSLPTILQVPLTRVLATVFISDHPAFARLQLRLRPGCWSIRLGNKLIGEVWMALGLAQSIKKTEI